LEPLPPDVPSAAGHLADSDTNLVLALWHKGNDGMRKLFILFALVFALVTTATATIVTSAVNSDAAMALATR
jgi:hypothetical protein